MAEKCNCGYCCSWLSGLFAAPAIMHLIRIIAKWEITFNGNPIAINTSWTIFVVTTLLSMIFAFISCKKHKADAQSSCCS